MIQLYDTKPCADHMDSVQAEGVISKEHFSLSYFESLLRQIGFRVFSVGNPLVLICRRPDCLLLVNSALYWTKNFFKRHNHLNLSAQNKKSTV